jgi:hypothetical protein
LRESQLTLLVPTKDELVPPLNPAEVKKISFAIWNSAGKAFMPVFSCAARAKEAFKILKQRPEDFRFHQIQGKMLFQLMFEQNLKHIVIVNPASSSGALELKPEHLEGLADGSIAEPPTPGEKAMEKLMIPGSFRRPDAMLKAVSEWFTGHPEVRAGWLFQEQEPPDPDAATRVLGLLVTTVYSRELEMEIEKAANATCPPPGRCRVWVLDPNDSYLAQLMADLPTFYAAPGFVRCKLAAAQPAMPHTGDSLEQRNRARFEWEPRNELEKAFMASIHGPEGQPEFFRQLRKGKLTFLSPYHPEMEGVHRTDDGTPISFTIWQNEGMECIPLFTSAERLAEALRTTGNENTRYCKGEMLGEGLFQVMVALKLEHNIVVNPACQGGYAILDRDAVRMLADGSILKPPVPTKMTNHMMELVEAADYPTDFVQTMFQFLRGKPALQAAWLFRQLPARKPDAVGYIIGLAITGEADPQLNADLAVVAYASCPPQCSFNVTVLDPKNPAVANTMAKFPPFYAAPDFQKPDKLPEDKT